MFKNYLKIAFRNMQKQKVYAVINIFGLAIGLACCILMFLYVHDELSFDLFHKNADRIVRIGYEGNFGRTARTQHILAPTLLQSSPQVENAVRIKAMDRPVILIGKEKFYEYQCYYTDPSLFEIFTFPFITGDAQNAFSSPNALILTKETAQRYFGDKNPLGETLEVVGLGRFDITGVVENVPRNSHFRFNLLISYQCLEAQKNPNFNDWGNFVTSTYVLLKKQTDIRQFEASIFPLVQRYRGAGEDENERFLAHRLTDIHLYDTLTGELGPGGSLANLTIFASLAIFILLIACMNYMNLTTAIATRRAREVGVRKVFGSIRKQLAQQFFGEALLLSIFGLAVALLMVELALPAFNAMAQKNVSLAGSPWWLPTFLSGIVLATGAIAGGYPAFVLSRFQPVSVLKGDPVSLAGTKFRRILVVTQFAISIVLIIGTLTIFSQLEYLQDKELGYNQERVLVLRMEDHQMRKNTETIKNELRQHPGILQVAAASNVPGKGLGMYMYKLDGQNEWIDCATYFIDTDYLKTLGIKVLKGRDFAQEQTTDAQQAFLVNASALEHFGWKDAIRKTVNWDDEKQGRIIGIVEDFHFQSLDEKIHPLILQIEQGHFRYLVIRISPSDISTTMAFIREKWEIFDPSHPFKYSFLDETFDVLFRQVERFIRIFGNAAALAIMIAYLGLFGLTTFAVDRLTKEIGIRKVLGATLMNVTALLSKDFVKLVLIANIIAWPVAWFAMNRWLQNFAYRVEIGWWVFALAGGLALVIALLTMSTQAIRAALANPVDALRYE